MGKFSFHLFSSRKSFLPVLASELIHDISFLVQRNRGYRHISTETSSMKCFHFCLEEPIWVVRIFTCVTSSEASSSGNPANIIKDWNIHAKCSLSLHISWLIPVVTAGSNLENKALQSTLFQRVNIKEKCTTTVFQVGATKQLYSLCYLHFRQFLFAQKKPKQTKLHSMLVLFACG